MYAPRNETLAESIYKDIDENEYLLELYDSLLHNYSCRLLRVNEADDPVDVEDALRFADILSKSTYPGKSDQHKVWGQEIAEDFSRIS